MATWKISAVQMDCALGKVGENRSRIERNLREVARQQARLAVFPECALTGYAFDNKDEAFAFAEPIPGPSTDRLAGVCRELDIWAAVGMLERDGEAMYNACALVGPNGLVAAYRKIHLPFLGVDRFTTPGDRPFAVHDIGGLRVGMSICYDSSFPETTRILMLLGADLVVLPTNWPTGAEGTVKYLVQCRAMENHLYYVAVNRIGRERTTRYIGQSRIVNVNGDLLASASQEEQTILFAEIDPDVARDKQIVRIPGKYEINRLKDRRPEMYGPITKPNEPEA